MIKKVIEREPENNTYLDTYAWVLYKNGKIREAIKVMDGIMEKDPKEDADWFEHYGYMMKSVKKCDVAISYWNRAMKADPQRSYLQKVIENCKR
jgi:predicted Zn-dependent protease